eukprot:UN13676
MIISKFLTINYENNIFNQQLFSQYTRKINPSKDDNSNERNKLTEKFREVLDKFFEVFVVDLELLLDREIRWFKS